MEDRVKTLEASCNVLTSRIVENSNRISNVLEIVAQINAKIGINDRSVNLPAFVNSVFQSDEESAEPSQISGKNSAFRFSEISIIMYKSCYLSDTSRTNKTS